MKTNLLLSKNLSEELKNTNYITQIDSDKLKSLDGISKLNVFVGANNSGKSRFVRGLLKLEDYILYSLEYQNKLNKLNELFLEINDAIYEKFYFSFHYHKHSNYPHLKKEMDLLNMSNKQNSNSSIPYSFNKSYVKGKSDYFKNLINNFDKNNNQNLNQELSNILGGLLIINGFFSYHTSILQSIPSTVTYNGLDISFSKQDIKSVKIIIDCTSLAINLIEQILEKNFNILQPKRIYIPTLRSAKTLISGSVVQEFVYSDTIKNTYFKDSSNFETKYPFLKIITGLDFYNEVKKVRNSKRNVRKSFEKFEVFLKKNFFNDKEVDIVALDNEKHLSFYLDDEDLEIHDLGDGIQALIVLMFPIFTAEKDSWIFIDEPEINLHPGMQRLFLEQLLNNPEISKKNLRFFITTHSNHFLDLTIPNENISIYSFSKIIGKKANEHRFLIRNVKPGDSSLLSELGVNNSSVFLANCSIWIEGITDRKYLSAFLYAYLKNTNKLHLFKEDVDYVFFEYAGSNLSHYFFSSNLDNEEKDEVRSLINAFAISNRVYLLADKDGDNKKAKHKFFNSLAKDNTNFNYQNTITIEIENLLSFSVLKKILVDILKQDSTIINEIINISEKDYANIHLGEFLNNRIGKRKGINLPKISDNKKTLNDRYKLKFANYFYNEVLSGNITWDMIQENKNAKKITMEIYKFINKYKEIN
uniref:AAA family ATPase n=1 Tax=Gelidibacter sp. TaxID=2018083 RepID=UPI004049772A